MRFCVFGHLFCIFGAFETLDENALIDQHLNE